MKLQKLAGTNCEVNECPTVFLSDRGTLVVQGDKVAEADGLTLSVGEQAVEISIDLLREAFSALGQ
jgi:hypothetical protein